MVKEEYKKLSREEIYKLFDKGEINAKEFDENFRSCIWLLFYD